MSEITKCPFCQIELIRNESSGDLECGMCERKWYPCEVDGEIGLAMRPRKVRVDFRELREGGDMRKAIRPA
jgi:hypothetical protein